MKKLLTILLLIFGILNAQTPSDSTISELENRLNSIKEENAEKVVILIQLCDFYRNASSTRSLYYGNKAIELSQKLHLKLDLSYAYRSLGNTYAFNGENDKAWNAFTKALTNDRQQKLEKSETLTLQNIGHFLLQLNDYSHATDYFIQSLAKSKELKDTLLLASQYKTLGETFIKINNSEKALEYYLQSRGFYENLNHQLAIAEINHKIGDIYLAEESFDKSIAYFTRSYNILKENALLNTPFHPTISLGKIYMTRKEYDLSRKFLEEAYETEKLYENNLGMSNALSQLSMLEMELGKYKKAEELLNESSILKKEIGDIKGEIDLYVMLSNLAKRQGDYKKSLSYLSSAYELALKTPDKEKILTIYQMYSKIYESRNELDKALHYSKEYALLADTIAKNEKDNNINEFNDFIMQSANRANEILEIDNQKQQQEITKQGNLQKLIFIGSILFILIGSVVFYFYRKQLKDKVEISTTKRLFEEMQQKFEHSEARYKAVVDQTHDIIFIQNKDKIVFANKKAIEVSGYDQLDFYNLKVTDFIYPDDLDDHYQRMLKRENGDNSLSKFKARLIDKQGIIRTYEIVSRQIELNDEIVILGSGRDLTESVATEEKLHKSEQLYKNLVQHSPTGIIYIDTNGNILERNKTAFDILSINNEVIYGSVNFYEIFPDPDSIIFKDIDKCISRGKVINNVMMLEVENNLTYVSYYLSPLLDQSGEVYSLLLNFENITEKKEIENSLRISEERSKLAFEGTSLGLWDWDIRTGKMIFNQVFFDLLGYTPGEIKNTREALDSLISPSDRDKMKRLIKKHLDNSSDYYYFEYKVLSKSGSWKWLSDQGKVVLRDDNNEPLRMVGTIRDITTQKEWEDKVTQSEKKYRSLIDNMQDGVFIFQDFKIKFSNEALANMLGYSISEIADVDLTDIIAPEYIEIIKEKHKARIEGIETESNYDVEFIHKDGTRLYVTLSVGLVHYKGKPASHGTAKNITESKRSQAILEQSELSLRDANATKDKFFSIIAHDLKNPFNAIMGFSNLLYEDFDDFSESDKRKFIKNIWDAAESTYKLLENLLQWSRAQAGKISYQPEVVELSNIANENVAVIKPHAEGKRIKLSSDVSFNTEVFADSNMIHTVIRNLVSNAIKFTPKDGKVTISSTAAGNFERICITDTGVGISKDNIAKLFKIDEQFKTDGTDNEKGTGLGLILCKEFVEKNGGEIWAESEIGKGSRFCFTVPHKKTD
jgi:PAS domain S-box-containing protein